MLNPTMPDPAGAVGQSRLPEGVQGIIAARLDLLPDEEKWVLQDAAVVGNVFWPGALRADVADVERTLHALERKDFVGRQRRSSVEGEDEYAFRHLLVRDVAYGSAVRGRVRRVGERGGEEAVGPLFGEAAGVGEDEVDFGVERWRAELAAGGLPQTSEDEP